MVGRGGSDADEIWIISFEVLSGLAQSFQYTPHKPHSRPPRFLSSFFTLTLFPSYNRHIRRAPSIYGKDSGKSDMQGRGLQLPNQFRLISELAHRDPPNTNTLQHRHLPPSPSKRAMASLRLERSPALPVQDGQEVRGSPATNNKPLRYSHNNQRFRAMSLIRI
ncbi:hypothetical protein AOLI_G00275540 [Acnodon oligacanthus]